MASAFTVPEELSFEDAISVAQKLLDEWEHSNLTDADLKQAIAALVSTENGARDFFVTYLSDARSLADHPISPLLDALVTAPAIVAPLLVKNLVMSTAMALTHRRNQNQDLATGSDRVKTRSHKIIESIPLPEVKQHAQDMATSLETGTGHYQDFLNRWGYDAEQRQVMAEAIAETRILAG